MNEISRFLKLTQWHKVKVCRRKAQIARRTSDSFRQRNYLPMDSGDPFFVRIFCKLGNDVLLAGDNLHI
jgi:hypothetical protein